MADDRPNGKIGEAPCGHPGVHVIGNYIQCLYGCDAFLTLADAAAREPAKTDHDPGDSDEFEDEPRTQPICKSCGSGNVSTYPKMHATGDDLHHCEDCHHSWH